MEETVLAINQRKNYKTPRNDAIIKELVKYKGDQLLQTSHQLIPMLCWNSKSICLMTENGLKLVSTISKNIVETCCWIV